MRESSEAPAGRAARRWRGLLASCAAYVLLPGAALAQPSDVINLAEIRIVRCADADPSGSIAARVEAETLRNGILQYKRGTDQLERPLKWFPSKGKTKTSYGVRGPMPSACSALVPGAILVVQEHWNEACDSSPDPQACWDGSRLIGPLPPHADRDLRNSAAAEAQAAPDPKPSATPRWDESQPLSEMQEF